MLTSAWQAVVAAHDAQGGDSPAFRAAAAQYEGLRARQRRLRLLVADVEAQLEVHGPEPTPHRAALVHRLEDTRRQLAALEGENTRVQLLENERGAPNVRYP